MRGEAGLGRATGSEVPPGSPRALLGGREPRSRRRQRVRKEAAAFTKWSQPWKAAPERPEPALQSTRAGGRGGCGRELPPGAGGVG